MARKMSTPMEESVVTPPAEIPVMEQDTENVGQNELQVPSNEETIKLVIGEFSKIKTIQSQNFYKTSKSNIEDSLQRKFNVVVYYLEEFGNGMNQCDNLMEMLDERQNPELFDEIHKFSVEIEKHYIIVVDFFVSLDAKDKMKYLGIEEDEIKIDEIDSWIEKINAIPYFSPKGKKILINDLEALKGKINSQYEKIMAASVGKLLANDLLMIVMIYVFFKIITYFLWDWVGYLLCIGCVWGMYKKYEQLSSVANAKGETDGLKVFLGSIYFGD